MYKDLEDITYEYTADTGDTEKYGWSLTIKEKDETDVVRKLGNADLTTKTDVDADDTNELNPKSSILDIKKEINGLLWYAMRTDKKIDKGFTATDRSENDKIDPEEDTNANIHVNDFNVLDTLSSAEEVDLFPNDPVDGVD
jgi:hypothetical protein